MARRAKLGGVFLAALSIFNEKQLKIFISMLGSE
jgi:hypothetical protein